MSSTSASDSDPSFDEEEADTEIGVTTTTVTSSQPKRPRVKRACVNCRKSKSACDGERPCKRCVRTELQATCEDHIPPKHRRRRVVLGPDGMPVEPVKQSSRSKSEKKTSAKPAKKANSKGSPSPKPKASSHKAARAKKASPVQQSKPVSPVSPDSTGTVPLLTSRSAFSLHPSVSTNSFATSILSSPLLSTRSDQSNNHTTANPVFNAFQFSSPDVTRHRFGAFSSSAPYSSTILSAGSPPEDAAFFISPLSASCPPSSASTGSASSGDSPPPVLPPSQYTQSLAQSMAQKYAQGSFSSTDLSQVPFTPIDPPTASHMQSCSSSSGTGISRKDVPSWFLITEEFALQTLAMHAVVTSSFTPTRQMVTAMAWVVHNTAHMEYELELAGLPLAKEARQPLQCVCHQWQHARSRSARTRVPYLSPTSSPSGTAAVSFYSAAELAHHGLQNFHVPRSLPIDPAQALVNFLNFHDQHEASVKALPFDFLPTVGSPHPSPMFPNSSSAYPPFAAVSSSDILSLDGGLFGGPGGTDDTLRVYIPPISSPPEPTRAEVSYYSAINHWRTMAPVQRALQHFYSKMQPYALEMQFSAEQALARLLPFAAVIIPLYPSSFIVPGWANEQFAVGLGYPAEEMRINSFTDFFRILDPSMLEDGFRAFRELIVTGKSSKTINGSVHSKSGRHIEVVTTVCIRYFECMPMMFVMYSQERPVGDATICTGARKASASDFASFSPQVVSTLLSRNG